MYEETACFEPNNSMVEGGSDDGFCQVLPLMAGSCSTTNSFEESLKLSMEELSHAYHQEESGAVASMEEIQLQHHMALNNNHNHHHLMQQYPTNHHQVLSYDHSSNWDPNINTQFQEMHQVLDQNGNFNAVVDTPSSLPPDLLNLFNLPRCTSTSSLLPNSSISFTNPAHKSPLGFLGVDGTSVLFDSNPLGPQPHLFRELVQSLPPHGYTLPTPLFGGGQGDDHMDGLSGGGLSYQDGDQGDGVFEFTAEMPCIGKGIRKTGKVTKHFATERERREHLNRKYTALRNLVPNPTKNDRASVVGDAIEYIKELLRTVQELKLLVEKKRCGRERIKRRKITEEDGGVEVLEHPNMKVEQDQSAYNNGSLRSSWLQRKSKDTEVDVRLIEDEVTIKLVQRKKLNCLLSVSKVLDELQLDLHHAAGGLVGDYYSFLFNTKINEGSCVYASAIANKLIEVVDRQHAASSTATSTVPAAAAAAAGSCY